MTSSGTVKLWIEYQIVTNNESFQRLYRLIVGTVLCVKIVQNFVLELLEFPH